MGVSEQFRNRHIERVASRVGTGEVVLRPQLRPLSKLS